MTYELVIEWLRPNLAITQLLGFIFNPLAIYHSSGLNCDKIETFITVLRTSTMRNLKRFPIARRSKAYWWLQWLAINRKIWAILKDFEAHWSRKLMWKISNLGSMDARTGSSFHSESSQIVHSESTVLTKQSRLSDELFLGKKTLQTWQLAPLLDFRDTDEA